MDSRKRTLKYVRHATIQISLRISAVWSEPLMCTFWITKDAKFLHVDNEGSDQTAGMRRLISVLLGAHIRRYVFSRYGSFIYKTTVILQPAGKLVNDGGAFSSTSTVRFTDENP